jgi:putative membrane protein
MSEPPLGVAVPDTREHPVYLVIGTAKTLRQAIPYLVVTIFGGAPWWVNAALFAVVMVIAVAQWHVKKYSVVGGVLLLRGGLLNRSVQAVPISRITALAASQSMSQRLIGVWGLDVQSAGDRNSSVITLACLSGHRLDELRDALKSSDRAITRTDSNPSTGMSPIRRYVAWRHTSVSAVPSHDRQVIAGLTTVEMLIAAASNSSIVLIFVAALVVWFEFSGYLPARTAEFMTEVVEPQGSIAVVTTLVLVAIVGGLALGALRFYRFTLIRDGEVLHTSRGLLGKQAATISVKRVQAVRIVEGPWRVLLGYCSLQVEVAGIGRANVDQRMLFPLVRTDRAEALIREALPELPWPRQPLHALPARVHRRYLTLPLGYAAGFTLLMVFLPGWWALLAALPLPLGYALGVSRAREARWRVDDQCVVLRWRRLLNRNMVVAHRGGAQVVELSTSQRKAKAGVAGFTMRFSSGRAAKMRYMVDTDALRLLHVVGRRADPRS